MGNFFENSDEDIINLLKNASTENIKKILKKLDGNFAIYLKTNSFILACVDRICSYPLTYKINNKKLFIADNGSLLEEKLDLKEKNLDYEVTSIFAMSGYIINNNTIYKETYTIEPGEFILFSKNSLLVEKYYQWKPWIKIKNKKFTIKNLISINEKIIKKLISSACGKQIVVPLSGGWDSRFIASGLKHFGYKNVVCVSYGKKNNTDMYIAKKVAMKLGFKWIKVDYTKKKVKEIYNSKDYKKYEKYCDNLNAIHFIGEYLMISELVKKNLIDKDAIFVNGQSGDFITGNHIPKKINEKSVSINQVIREYIIKHNKYWKLLMTEDQKKIVKLHLKEQIIKITSNKIKNIRMFGLYEALEFYNRQVKYVINGVRNYEYFEFSWRMPLWDNEYLNYWEKAPYSLKYNQAHYKEAIMKSNWGNVWNDIEINSKIKMTLLMKILRFFLKIFFIRLGKESWHSFERKYLEYFFDDLLAYSPWSYTRIFFDKRIHYSPISWYIEDYLKKKNIQWSGKKNL